MKKTLLAISVFLGCIANAQANCDIILNPQSTSPGTQSEQKKIRGEQSSNVNCNIPQIIITGERPLPDNGFMPTWENSFPVIEMSGGGGGPGTWPGNKYWYDDGTRGLNQNSINRYTPGCTAEQLFAIGLAVEVANSGTPVGTLLNLGVITNPLYNNGLWRKYQASSSISRHAGLNDGYVTRKQIVIHYMYNMVTNEIDDVKFKNSFESGCSGYKQALQ